MGTILAVANNKGGVGKTAVSCNLACALARQKKKVLFIDMDSQSNSTRILLSKGGRVMAHDYSIDDLIDPATNDDRAINEYVRASPHQSNLYVIPNERSSSRHELTLAEGFPANLPILKNKIFAYAKENYDYTVIDTPPNIGVITTTALCSSELVVVPIDTMGSDSMEGLPQAIDLIKSVQETFNQDLRFFKMLLNRVHRRRAICSAIIGDLENKFDKKLQFKTVIPDNTALQQATYAAVPIFAYNQAAQSARAFRALAIELIQIIEQETA